MEFGRKMMSRIGSSVLAVVMSIALFPKISGADEVRADETSATKIEFDLTSGTFECDSEHSDVLIELMISELFDITDDSDYFYLDVDKDGNDDIFVPIGGDFSMIKAQKTNIRGTYTITKEQIDLSYDEICIIFSNEVLVTYDINGGSKGALWVESEYVQIGSKITLDRIGPEYVTPPAGKELSHFLVEDVIRDDYEKYYMVGTTVVITEATTIQYVWKDEVKWVTCTIDLNGGTPAVDDLPLFEKVVLGETFQLQGVLSEDYVIPPEGYKFDGYEIEGLIIRPGDSYTVTHDYIMKVHWVPAGTQHCTLVYKDNDGKVGPKYSRFKNVLYGTTITLGIPDSDFIAPPTGMELCYYLVNDVMYAIGSEITITDLTVIEFGWKPAGKYATATFDLNGGVNKAGIPLVDCILIGTELTFSDLPETTLTPPKQGYAFSGYEIEGVFYSVGSQYTLTHSIVIKIVWKKVEPELFNITYDANGGVKGSGWQDTLTIPEGTAIPVAAPDPSVVSAPAGKEFEGFEIAGVVYPAGTTYTIIGNVTIKYLWKEIQAPEPAKDPSFEEFVERLYTVALGRASEPEGKAFWVEQVVKNGFTGADCARFFMLGAPEFLGRNLTDDEFVEVLYKTYFDRESEPDGKAYWMGRLASGENRAVLVEEFIESVEWCNVCAGYGVKSGALYHKATVPSKNAVKFATRLYTCCLGRDPEEDGLNYWALALTNLDATGYQAASLFFTLPEFVGLKTTNEEYLTRLYTTFMGREPEADGFNYWLGLLNGGTDRNDVMKAFAGCPEFQEICNQYGIVRGEI